VKAAAAAAAAAAAVSVAPGQLIDVSTEFISRDAGGTRVGARRSSVVAAVILGIDFTRRRGSPYDAE